MFLLLLNLAENAMLCCLFAFSYEEITVYICGLKLLYGLVQIVGWLDDVAG